MFRRPLLLDARARITPQIRSRAVKISVLLVLSLGLGVGLLDPTGLWLSLRNVVVLAFILTAVVGLHEFCHLLTALALGIKPKEFGLAFGPKIVGKTKFGIYWRINALPIGGYVQLVGEKGDEGLGSFTTAPAWKKIAILLAGPLSNFLLTAVLLVGLVALMRPNFPLGADIESARLIVVIIVEQTVAAVVAFFPHATATPLAMPLMGIPGMVGGVGQMIDFGPYMVVIFAAAISASTGLINLLPIPPLDGGQALVALLHGVLGRFYPERAMRLVTLTGFAFLVLLMVSINGIDLIRTILGIPTPGS